jgi:hypothetical protein
MRWDCGMENGKTQWEQTGNGSGEGQSRKLFLTKRKGRV